MNEEKYLKHEREAEEFLKIVNNLRQEEKQMSDISEDLQNIYIQDLDQTAKSNNFTSESISDLPILPIKDSLLSIIESNSVVIIQGPTGCGKSTQIPKLILDNHIKKKLFCNIIVTQPRRIAAVSIAKRVSQEMGYALGTLVGYRISMQQMCDFETRLIYCTTEYLLQLLINKKHMYDFTHVIIDEVHERNQELDFLMLVVKKLLQTNSRLVKVILMSATINVRKFANYFSIPIKNKLTPAPVVKISNKRRFKTHIYYLDDIKDIDVEPNIPLQPKMSEYMINICIKIIIALDQIDINDNEREEKENKDTAKIQRHTVLIFLPGIYEMEELYTILSSKDYNDKLWDLVMLHSMISSTEQNRIFYKPPLHHRQIILSTNIAESSITVPDVKYVIDFCLTKMLVFDPASNYQSLKLYWTSKVNCTQRAGRTGRTMDGRVYRLVTRTFYNNILEVQNPPEILRASLTNVVLRAKIFDFCNPKSFLSMAIDPPNLEKLPNTIVSLKECGALINEKDMPLQFSTINLFDGKLTDLGRIMASLPLNIQISKLIMLGHAFGILQDAIILGASIELNDMFISNYSRSTVSSYTMKKIWSQEVDSDCIASLNAYKTWQNEKANRRLASSHAELQWAKRNGIELRILRELDILVNKITKQLNQFGVKETIGTNKVIWEGQERDFVLQVILAGAFYPNYFVKYPQNKEIQEDSVIRNLNTLNPMTTVYLRGWPLNQPGYLYAKKLRKIFSQCHGIPEKQIIISFDKTQRVYVEHRANETMTSDESLYRISDFVYKAVKMRLCRNPINIGLLSAEKAQEKSKDEDLDRFEKSVYFNKAIFSKRKSHLSEIGPELPNINITHISLCIQNIISPGYFWAILDDEDTRKKMSRIEFALNAHPLQEFSTHPKIATMVAAPIEKDSLTTYHRAIIENSILGIANIFFIDHGCASRVPFRDLRVIDDVAIMKLPSLAFRCVLASIRPANNVSTTQGRWSRVARDRFQAQIHGSKKIVGKIYSVAESTVNLELIVDNNGEEINMNEYLIENGYAVRREESYSSKSNHDLRMNINISKTMSPEEISFRNEQQYSTDLLEYPEPPEEKDCISRIELQGPYSPLEINMISLTAVGKNKKVIITSNSVNSVLLDENTDRSSRLLIAHEIMQSNRETNNLILHKTTLLPNMPGLTALLALIFAPHIELRRSFLGTYYTGVLCGLGPINNNDQKGIFPDHNIEVPFDVEISINDLQEINKMRHWMNAALQLPSNNNYNNDDSNDDNDRIINCQIHMKNALLELRNRNRQSQEFTSINYSHQWNRYEEMLFLHPARDMENDRVYPLHKALRLEEKNDELEEMVKHLATLNRLINQDAHKLRNTKILCKLCDIEMIGLFSLRRHLCSDQHKVNENSLQVLDIRECYYDYY